MIAQIAMDTSTSIMMVGLLGITAFIAIASKQMYAWMILGLIGLSASLLVIGQIDIELFFTLLGIAFLLIAFVGGISDG